jgi:hypothetical protein
MVWLRPAGTTEVSVRIKEPISDAGGKAHVVQLCHTTTFVWDLQAFYDCTATNCGWISASSLATTWL